MYKYLLLLVFYTKIITYAEIYYPDGHGNVYYNSEIRKIITNNRTQLVPHIASENAPYDIIPQNAAFSVPTQNYESYVDDVVSQGLSKFSVMVNRLLTSKSDYDTVVFSPISIAGALSLVLLGANGKTFQEITNILGFVTGIPDIDKKTEIIHTQFARIIDKLQKSAGFSLEQHYDIAVGVFLQNNYPIRREYQKFAMQIYQSEVLNLNFRQNPSEAQKTINAWVSDRTKGKIKEIMEEPPSSNTNLIIASALYFKAQWEYPFFEGATRRKPFYTNGTDKPSNIQVDMMANGGEFPYFKDNLLQAEILGFPYKGNLTTMYIIKPFNSNHEILKRLENQLTMEHIRRLVMNVRYTPAVVLFPKMLIDSTIDLRDTLMQVGLKSLFDPKESNLALLSPGPINTMFESSKTLNVQNNGESMFIFNRFKKTDLNDTTIANKDNNMTTTHKKVGSNNNNQFRASRNRKSRATEQPVEETLDSLREKINKHINSEKFENPGLYADKVIHKVFMEVTEVGTEAAATTLVGLSKTGSRLTFRAEVPFLFFIWHEETKILLFFGSVHKPTPYF